MVIKRFSKTLTWWNHSEEPTSLKPRCSSVSPHSASRRSSTVSHWLSQQREAGFKSPLGPNATSDWWVLTNEGVNKWHVKLIEFLCLYLNCWCPPPRFPFFQLREKVTFRTSSSFYMLRLTLQILQIIRIPSMRLSASVVFVLYSRVSLAKEAMFESVCYGIRWESKQNWRLFNKNKQVISHLLWLTHAV